MTKEINIIIGGFDDGRTPNVQQYDVGSRMFLCRLWEKPGVAYQMAENAFVGVVFEWRRAKPTGEYETKVIDRSTVLVTVPGAATQIAGAVKMQLVIHQAGGQLYGPKITFMALESLKASDVEPEEPKLLLETLIEKTQKAADRVDQMQIDASGLAGDSNKLGGEAPEYYLSPRNLLDNSDFANPVNQRGQSDYSFDDGYTIDRWRLYWNGDGRVSVKNGYIELFRETYSAFLFQHMANVEEMVGKTYTVAAKCRYNGNIGWIDSTQRVSNVVQSLDWIITTHTFTVNSSTSDVHGQAAVEISSLAGLSFEVEWIALYEGAYTAETLPPYVPKGYAAELAECQRYFERIGYAPAGGCHASCCFAATNYGDFRVLQGYKQTKRINSPTILINGVAEGEIVSMRNAITNQMCTGTLSIWNNIFPDRLNTFALTGGTSETYGVYEAYIDVCADL